MERIKEYISHLQTAISTLPIDRIKKVVEILLEAYRDEKRVFIIGNGGSAATASHFACDLGKGTICEGGKRFKVISLTDNIPLMTAWANDSGYDHIFKEQLENLLEIGDVVIGISASGNSKNILDAIEYANSKDCITIGFTGFNGGKLSNMVEECIIAKSDRYGPVEDIHLILDHIVTFCILGELTNESVPIGSRIGHKVATIN